MKKQEIGFSTRLTREDVAGIVEATVEGLKEGLLKVQKSGESLDLPVPRVIDLDVKGSLDEHNALFSIEVSWRPNREENPDLVDTPPDADTKEEKNKSVKKAARDEAKSNMREAAVAAKAAASSAGKAVKQAAKVAACLLKEGTEKVKVQAENLKKKSPEGLGSKLSDLAGSAAEQVRDLVKCSSCESSKPKDGAASGSPSSQKPEEGTPAKKSQEGLFKGPTIGEKTEPKDKK